MSFNKLDIRVVGASSGKSQHGLYRVWLGMINRCHDASNKRYDRYGGRGITVCYEWQEYDNFYADNVDKYNPSLQIDRTDNDKGYFKDNVRWVTRKVNCNNRSFCINFEYDGLTATATEHAERLGVNPRMVLERLSSGWDYKRALEEPKGANTARKAAGDKSRAKKLEISKSHDAKLRRYEYNGKKHTMKELSEMTGLTTKLLRKRINERGWTVDRAVNTR